MKFKKKFSTELKYLTHTQSSFCSQFVHLLFVLKPQPSHSPILTSSHHSTKILDFCHNLFSFNLYSKQNRNQIRRSKRRKSLRKQKRNSKKFVDGGSNIRTDKRDFIFMNMNQFQFQARFLCMLMIYRQNMNRMNID